MMIHSLFDEAALQRISEAVSAAERHTTAELVPVVITRCDSYSEGRYRGAMVGLGAMTLIAPLVPSVTSLAGFVVMQVLGLALGFWISSYDPIERALIGKKTLNLATRARAERAFLENGLQRTQAATGVLIFVSLFEHSIVVLADTGVTAKIDASAWTKVTAAFTARMRQQQPVEGLCDALSTAGELLAGALPSRPGSHNPNELPDRALVST